MITSINRNNSSQYDAIFNEVQNYLNACGIDQSLWPEDEADTLEEILAELNALSNGVSIISQWQNLYYILKNSYADNYLDNSNMVRITSLQLYFGIIGDLVSIDGKYGVFPLDEPCFEINANSRTITIPKTFTGIQIQGDHYAETFYFRIARYFDTTDLFTHNIEIRYELPNGQGYGKVEPWIKLIDEQTGDIIFGWALSEVATAKHGSLKFAVNFYTIGSNNAKEYSFNTLTAEIPIRKGLTFSSEDQVIQEEYSREDILKRFKNGYIQNAIEIDPPEITYCNFENNSYYISSDFGTTGIYSLLATAISPDAGDIYYKWFKKTGNETIYDIIENTENKTLVLTGYATCICDLEKVIEVKYNEKVLTSNFTKNDTLNILDDFIKYYDCWRNDGGKKLKLSSASELIYDDEGQSQFEIRLSECLVEAPGNYYCSIENRVGLQTTKKQTGIALFPLPIAPNEYTNNLIREGYSSELDINLSIEPATFENSLPSESKVYYQWEKVNTIEDTFENNNSNAKEESKDDEGKIITPSYKVEEAGIYACKVFNRVNNTNSQGVYKYWSVEEPSIPKLYKDEIEIKNNDILLGVLGNTLEISIDNASNFDLIKYSIIPEEGKNLNTQSFETTDNKILINLTNMIKYTIEVIGCVGQSFVVESNPISFVVNVGA